MDEITRLRQRRSDFAPSPKDLGLGGTARFLGRVASSGSALGAGKFALVNPAIVLGTETEGSPATIAVDTAISVPVYQVDALANGDLVVCRFVDHRWVATKRPGTGGGGTPILIGIPGCFCNPAPKTLSCTVTYGPGETSATYGGAYQSCPLVYYSGVNGDRPFYLASKPTFGPGWYTPNPYPSTGSSGTLNYLVLGCNSTQFTVAQGNSDGQQVPYQQTAGLFYTFAVGGRGAVNFCDPFGLYRGNTYPGTYFNGNIVITG